MSFLIDNYDDLLDIYIERFGEISLGDEVLLKKEFDVMIRYELDFMPFWFVKELIRLGYE